MPMSHGLLGSDCVGCMWAVKPGNGKNQVLGAISCSMLYVNTRWIHHINPGPNPSTIDRPEADRAMDCCWSLRSYILSLWTQSLTKCVYIYTHTWLHDMYIYIYTYIITWCIYTSGAQTNNDSMVLYRILITSLLNTWCAPLVIIIINVATVAVTFLAILIIDIINCRCHFRYQWPLLR